MTGTGAGSRPAILHRLAAGVAVVGALGSVALALACGPREPLEPPRAWERYCARCHGDDGAGDPKNLRLKPELNLLASQRLTADPRDRAFVVQRITEGHGSMPGFGHKLSPEEIDALAAWTIERFGDAPETNTPSPPTEGD